MLKIGPKSKISFGNLIGWFLSLKKLQYVTKHLVMMKYSGYYMVLTKVNKSGWAIYTACTSQHIL